MHFPASACVRWEAPGSTARHDRHEQISDGGREHAERELPARPLCGRLTHTRCVHHDPRRNATVGGVWRVSGVFFNAGRVRLGLCFDAAGPLEGHAE